MVPPEYIGRIHQGQNTNQVHKVHKSMKPWIEKKERKPNSATQCKRVFKERSLTSESDFSKSSKCQLFLSSQMHHIKQWGTIIQITPFLFCPNFPFQ